MNDFSCGHQSSLSSGKSLEMPARRLRPLLELGAIASIDFIFLLPSCADLRRATALYSARKLADDRSARQLLEGALPNPPCRRVSEVDKRLATVTDAAFSAALRLPTRRMAQLTPFFTKFRSSLAACSIQPQPLRNGSSGAFLS